jgi:hypothetical protein
MRLVVVVLPCVPATAIPCFRRISSASISARGTMGMPRSRAAAISGLSSAIGRRDDDRIGTRDVRREVSRADLDAEAREARGDGARGDVRSGDPIALRDEDLRDAAHAGAADADEVDALDLVLHRAGSQRDARIGDTIGGIAARELAPGDGHREQRLPRERPQRRGEPFRTQLRLGNLLCRARLHQKVAFALCSSAIAPGQRHDDRSQPTAASSAMVIAPPRHRTRSAAA